MGNACCCQRSPDGDGNRGKRKKSSLTGKPSVAEIGFKQHFVHEIDIGSVTDGSNKESAADEADDKEEGDKQQTEDNIWDEDAQERDEINILRMWLFNDLPMFVINNALMSVQFFQNFKEETKDLRKELRKAEAHEIPGHRFKFYQADKLTEIVGTHVVFRPKHGTLSNSETLLHPLRSYVLYKNVQVQWNKDEATHCVPKNVERPFYVMQTEDIADVHLTSAGYLSLKVMESKNLEAIYESIDPIQSPRNSPPAEKRPSTDFLQLPKQEETAYGYTTIRKLTTAKPAKEFRRGCIPASSCTIPRDTFTLVERRLLDSDFKSGEPTTECVPYLNSVKFMQQFLDALFDCLSEPLNLGQELDLALVQGSRMIINQGIATCHIMPAIPCKFWPDSARGFLNEGNVKDDDDDDAAWPKSFMRRLIENMEVIVLPLGYLKRRGLNPDFELQWRYACPQAEQYLLFHTMHAHVRCYLFTLAIFKTYLEDTFLGLDHTHIQHILFNEIRKNFEAWPEDRPAENLLHFLTVIAECIKKRNIRDFILHDRNMIESSPYLILNKVQGQLTALLENPLPYILLALKNLRYRKPFYPELDFSHVYQLATEKNIIPIIYPHLVQAKIEKTESTTDDDDDKQHQDRERLWAQKRAKELKMKKEKETRRASVETINIYQTPLHCSTDEDAAAGSERRQALLNQFIQHFIEMARASKEFKATAQSRIYLQQAKRLNYLLREENSDLVDSYAKLIRSETENNQEKSKLISQTTTINKDNPTNGIRLSLHSRPLPVPPTP